MRSKNITKFVTLLLTMAMLLCLMACGGGNAEFESQGSIAYELGGLRYRLLTSGETAPGETYPLVLFLHGSSGAGRDNISQMIPGQVSGVIEGVRLHGEPSFVYFPQYPSPSRSWGQSAKTRRQVMDALWQIAEDYPVDTSRIYITGLSSGGNGTWHFLHDYPGVFAAAMPLCGWYEPKGEKLEDIDYSFLLDIPLQIAHNSGDDVVDAEGSRRIVRALDALGHESMTYTEYPWDNHNCWSEFYNTPAVWDWLFAQIKK